MRKIYFTLIATLMATCTYAQDSATSDTESTPNLITEQPAGTLLKGFYNHSEGYIKQLSTIYKSVDDGSAKDVVIGNDGSVYIKNPVQGFITNTWMKATKGTGDTLIVTLPQTIYASETSDGVAYNSIQRMVRGADVDGNINYVADPSSNTIRFIMRNDSIFKAPEDKDAILALTYPSGNWAGFGSTSIVLNKVTDTPAAPANAKLTSETYSMTTKVDDENTDTRVINVAIEGNDIYLGNINDNQPEQWTKGKIEGNKAIFEGNVYMGLDTVANAHTYFFPANKKTIEYETMFGTSTYDSIWFEKQLVFDYDATNKTLKSDGGFVINQGSKTVNSLTAYWAPSLSPWKEIVSAPADPKIDYFEPYNDIFNYCYIQFFVNKTDAEGNQLNSKNLYYNIYMDDELMTFAPGDYMITEPMTDIPYDYTNDWDFFIDNQKHTIYFYVTGFSKIGIQAFYLDGDKKLKSNMVTYQVEADGIKAIGNDNKTIESIDYFDLFGRKVNKPSHGLYVKNINYTDGTVKTVKTMIK